MWRSALIEKTVYFILFLLALYAIVFGLRTGVQLLRKLSPTKRRLYERLLLVLVGIFIGLSLAKYTPTDYAKVERLHVTLAPTVSNWCGVVGAYVSYWLMWTFGYMGFIVPLWLILLGLLYNRKESYAFHFHVLPILLLIFLPLWLTLFGLPISYTGNLGIYLKTLLFNYIGALGTYLVAGAIFIALLLPYLHIRKLPRIGVSRAPARKPKPLRKKPAPIPQPSPQPTSHTVEVPDFKQRFLAILHEPPPRKAPHMDDLEESIRKIESRLKEFGITGHITGVTKGPVVSTYEYTPDPGIKLSKIVSLSDEIALTMKSERVRVVAPIPGKSAIGIEIPNKDREYVYLKELLLSDLLPKQYKLPLAMGKSVTGEPIFADLSTFPHLLIAGATGSGKSVFINTIVATLIFDKPPEEVRFLMIDPKGIELPVYNGIPHLIRPAIRSPKLALSALKDATTWMDYRYNEFAHVGARDIESYNKKMQPHMPYIVIIIDELADLMMVAPRDIETLITRLAQMSRAVGMHLVLATQRPSVDVITGLIKANFPARVAFQVASRTDSRTILDMNGAEKLLGKGDMLFIPPGKGLPIRIHGAYISTEEAKGIANLWAERHLRQLLAGRLPEAIATDIIQHDLIDAIVEPTHPARDVRIEQFANSISPKYNIPASQIAEVLQNIEYYPPLGMKPAAPSLPGEKPEPITSFEDEDPLFEEAKRLVIRHQVASVSMLQRHFKIGYARAGRLIDMLERAGIVGPFEGSKARKVLVPREALDEES